MTVVSLFSALPKTANRSFHRGCISVSFILIYFLYAAKINIFIVTTKEITRKIFRMPKERA